MLAPTKLWRSVTAALRSRRPRPRIALFLVLPVLLAACVANPTAIGVGPGQAVPPGGESAALVRVADSMRDAGDVAGAIPFYRRAHQLDTLQATPLIRLAVALHTVRAYDEASRTWRSALKLDPDNADARRGYGYSLIALNKPQPAIDQLRTSNEIEEDVRSYNGLGVAYDMIGDTRGAQMHYRMGLQVAPDNMTLLNNLLSATALAASSEAMVLGVKSGLDPRVMVDVLNVSSGRNSATLEKIPRAILPRTFDVGFRTELQIKDIRLCLEQADQLGVPMWIGQTVREMWAFAESQGGGQEDISAIIKHMEKWAGVTVRESS